MITPDNNGYWLYHLQGGLCVNAQHNKYLTHVTPPPPRIWRGFLTLDYI
jgi:hypothetical protein